MKTTGEAGADPEMFERRGQEAIIYKILERGGPKSLKVPFECSFHTFSYKSFANILPPGGGGGGGGMGPAPKSATVKRSRAGPYLKEWTSHSLSRSLMIKPMWLTPIFFFQLLHSLIL